MCMCTRACIKVRKSASTGFAKALRAMLPATSFAGFVAVQASFGSCAGSLPVLGTGNSRSEACASSRKVRESGAIDPFLNEGVFRPLLQHESMWASYLVATCTLHSRVRI